jgi:hypothetical protein
VVAPASLSASREYLKKGLIKLLKGYGYLEGTGEEYDEEKDMYMIVYAPLRRLFVSLQVRVRCEAQRLCLAK